MSSNELVSQAYDKLKDRLIAHYVEILAGKIIYLLYYLIDPGTENTHRKDPKTGQVKLEKQIAEAVGLLRSFRSEKGERELLDGIKWRMGLFFEENEIEGILEETEGEIKKKLRRIKQMLIGKGEEERPEFHESGLLGEVSAVLNTNFLLS